MMFYKKKVVLIILILIVSFLSFSIGFFIYENYSEEEIPETSSPSEKLSSSAPSRCSLIAKNDTYEKPDFSRLENVMSEQPIVKDIPKTGRISLKFFHFTEGCRIWDKSYILSDGKINPGGGEADIHLTLSSDYTDEITEGNFCEIIKLARNNGDLGQYTEASKATLLWRYKSIIKYAECLGIKLS